MPKVKVKKHRRGSKTKNGLKAYEIFIIVDSPDLEKKQ